MNLEKSNRVPKTGLSDRKTHKVDHLTEIIGVFGLFHAVFYMAIAFSIVIHAWQMFSNKFYTHKTDFWCAKPENQVNLSTKSWLNLSAPRLKLGNDERGFGQCEIFDVDYSTITTRPDENTETKTCTSWEYNTEQFDVSLYTALHLVLC